MSGAGSESRRPLLSAATRNWLFALLLMLTLIFSLIDRFALSVLIEPIKREFQISDTQFGLINGVAFGLFYAVMGLPLGWLADRWSRRGTMTLGVVIWSLCTSLCGFAGNFSQLLAARIGVGAGEAALLPAGWAMIYARFPRDIVGRAMSLVQAGSLMGAGIAIYVVGRLYSYLLAHPDALPLIGGFAAWKQTFVLIGLPGIFFAAALMLVRDERPKEARSVAAARLWPALQPNLLIFGSTFLGMGLMAMSVYALLSWMPAILMRSNGWSAAQVGNSYGLLVIIVAPAGVLIGGAACDALNRRLDRWTNAFFALGAAACALPLFVMLTTARTPSAILAIAAALHFVLTMPLGIMPAYLQSVTPADARSRMSALYLLVMNFLGLGLGPVLVGAVSDTMGGSASNLLFSLGSVCAGAVGLAILCFFWLIRTKPVEPA